MGFAIRIAGVSLLLASVIAACTGFAAKGDAEKAVDTFHQMLDAERYADIYDVADDVFKAAATKSDFTRILQAVHTKLGAVRSAKQTGAFSQDRVGTNAGSYLQLTYDTEFAAGRATEMFTWRVAGGTVRLAGYNINSPVLITG